VCLLQLAREVLDIGGVMVKPGVTTEEIDHAVHLVHVHTLAALMMQFGFMWCNCGYVRMRKCKRSDGETEIALSRHNINSQTVIEHREEKTPPAGPTCCRCSGS